MSNEYKRNSWASCWLPGTQAGSIGRTIYNNYCSSQQILCHLHNSVLSYIISGLNLLWSDRSYTSLWQCVHTEFWDSAVYPVDGTGFLSFFHEFTIINTAWCTLHCLEGSLWSMDVKYHLWSMDVKYHTVIFILATNGCRHKPHTSYHTQLKRSTLEVWKMITSVQSNKSQPT